MNRSSDFANEALLQIPEHGFGNSAIEGADRPNENYEGDEPAWCWIYALKDWDEEQRRQKPTKECPILVPQRDFGLLICYPISSYDDLNWAEIAQPSYIFKIFYMFVRVWFNTSSMMHILALYADSPIRLSDKVVEHFDIKVV